MEVGPCIAAAKLMCSLALLLLILLLVHAAAAAAARMSGRNVDYRRHSLACLLACLARLFPVFASLRAHNEDWHERRLFAIESE